MAYKSVYEFHHHFPKLAEESGFCFNMHRPRERVDWNKIRQIDLECLVRDRKFVVIEQHLSDILGCVLESEFDVRILDESVTKLFRLAQLAVEYQQFCRHYLDRSVFVLKEEINSLGQELEVAQKQIREKEEEIKKLKKRTKHPFKAALPYGNDNIANMILKTLTNRSDLYPSTSNADAIYYNKCDYCDKVFLNQLYLQSHVTRRHANMTQIPQKEVQNETHTGSPKLSAEITELKTKLRDMEQIILNKPPNNNPIMLNPTNSPNDGTYLKDNNYNRKDAAVSTDNENYLLSKFEEWKKEEHERYNKEISVLRNQILETITSLKEQGTQKLTTSNDNIEELQITIMQQGAEILSLKKELHDSKSKSEAERVIQIKEAEAQLQIWTKRAEQQSKEYEILLQKLNEVAKDASESRALAKTEKESTAELQVLLSQKNNEEIKSVVDGSSGNHLRYGSLIQTIPTNKISDKKSVTKKIPNQISDRKSLESLHRKAQELLNIESISSSSSILSNDDKTKSRRVNKRRNLQLINNISNNSKLLPHSKNKANSVKKYGKNNNISEVDKENTQKKLRNKNIQNHPELKTESSQMQVLGSPVKVLRAKLTEEVNNRLIEAGVDPLKNGIPHQTFKRQRTQLQKQLELKSKRNSVHDKVRLSILTYLDIKTTNKKKDGSTSIDYVSPNKSIKPHRSFTSLISNVKSKALSLVKLNEARNKEKRQSLNDEVDKRALSLLKTPPGSLPESPLKVTDKYELNKDSSHSKARNILESKIPQTSDFKNVQPLNYKYINSPVQQTTRSIENLIKSPARRPSSANTDMRNVTNDVDINQTQIAIRLNHHKPNIGNTPTIENENSSDDVDSISDTTPKKEWSEDNVSNSRKQTKGVLKNASSTSSLNKKKVLFDMDAIQMKSVSASPSQSTEKSDVNEKYELGLVNLNGNEWDLSSIENEPFLNDTKIQIQSRTSPKIAELKQSIESQLARRNPTLSTVPVGGVDVLKGGPIARAASVGGSNTSLGSSILDESESVPEVNDKAFIKVKRSIEKDESEFDISEFSIDGIVKQQESF